MLRLCHSLLTAQAVKPGFIPFQNSDSFSSEDVLCSTSGFPLSLFLGEGARQDSFYDAGWMRVGR